MHDVDSTMRIFARAWPGVMGALAVFGIIACTLGTGERREASRRTLRNGISGNGWFLLSITLKYIGFAFPHADYHLTWLWIPAFIFAVLSWSIKGLRWFIRRRKRTKPVETSYTRELRRASRKKP